MPSSPGYKRDLKQEYATQVKRGEAGVGSDSPNAQRKRLRRKAVKAGLVKPGDGKDLAHKLSFSKGGGGDDLKDAKVQKAGANRSFARNKDGSMKSETSKREKRS